METAVVFDQIRLPMAFSPKWRGPAGTPERIPDLEVGGTNADVVVRATREKGIIVAIFMVVIVVGWLEMM